MKKIQLFLLITGCCFLAFNDKNNNTILRIGVNANNINKFLLLNASIEKDNQNMKFDGQYTIYSKSYTSAQSFPYNGNTVCLIQFYGRGLHSQMEEVDNFHTSGQRLILPNENSQTTIIDACFQLPDGASCLIYRKKTNNNQIHFLRGPRERVIKMAQTYKKLYYDHIHGQFYALFDHQSKGIYKWPGIAKWCDNNLFDGLVQPVTTMTPAALMLELVLPFANKHYDGLETMMRTFTASDEFLIAAGNLYFIHRGAVYRKKLSAANSTTTMKPKEGSDSTFVCPINAEKFNFIPFLRDKNSNISMGEFSIKTAFKIDFPFKGTDNNNNHHAFWMSLAMSIETILIFALLVFIAFLKSKVQLANMFGQQSRRSSTHNQQLQKWLSEDDGEIYTKNVKLATNKAEHTIKPLIVKTATKD